MCTEAKAALGERYFLGCVGRVFYAQVIPALCERYFLPKASSGSLISAIFGRGRVRHGNGGFMRFSCSLKIDETGFFNACGRRKKPAGFYGHLKERLGWPFERAALLAADGFLNGY